MKNLYQSGARTCNFFFIALLMLVVSSNLSAQTTVSFTNSTFAAIPDDGYDGSLGSMAGTSVTVSGIPANAVILDMKVTAALNHTWVGDLTLKLLTPDGTVFGIMSRPGYTEPADD